MDRVAEACSRRRKPGHSRVHVEDISILPVIGTGHDVITAPQAGGVKQALDAPYPIAELIIAADLTAADAPGGTLGAETEVGFPILGDPVDVGVVLPVRAATGVSPDLAAGPTVERDRDRRLGVGSRGKICCDHRAGEACASEQDQKKLPHFTASPKHGPSARHQVPREFPGRYLETVIVAGLKGSDGAAHDLDGAVLPR